jgi:hypothetical protein
MQPARQKDTVHLSLPSLRRCLLQSFILAFPTDGVHRTLLLGNVGPGHFAIRPFGAGFSAGALECTLRELRVSHLRLDALHGNDSNWADGRLGENHVHFEVGIAMKLGDSSGTQNDQHDMVRNFLCWVLHSCGFTIGIPWLVAEPGDLPCDV